MNIREQLKVELSKWNMVYVSEYVGDNPARFRELWELVFPENYPVSQRAAWALEGIVEQYHHMIKPYLVELLTRLPGIKHDAIKRHMMKILTYQEIPEEYLGNLIDLCFQWLEQNDLPVAVKVHSMQVIYNTIHKYPELREEFIAVLEEQMPRNSVGFKSRATRLIRALEKQDNS
jgi:hypothetical protein